MILDTQSLFSDDQSVTVDAASTNIIDLGAPGTPAISDIALKRDIGPGTPIEILVQLTADATGTSPTIIAILQNDNDVAFGSATELARSASLADGVAGDRLSLRWIPESTDERYLRLYYDVSGTTPVHVVTAGITLGNQTRPV